MKKYLFEMLLGLGIAILFVFVLAAGYQQQVFVYQGF